ncbi:MAG: lipocalin-like domain-containing protein [Muribaculaceae bacterium]|jgi:hypothetical protein|nr:lipocalin-like domain-containing protein [Muribaculaceae bacterium]
MTGSGKETLLMLSVSLMLLLTACTHNGGYIGPWGGTWHLENIETGDFEEIGYAGNVFWKFQADVIDMVETDDKMHERHDHYGTWHASEDSRILTLDFSHGSDKYPEGSPDYIPPKVTGLREGLTYLEVLMLSGKRMKLRWNDAESGISRIYILKKQ